MDIFDNELLSIFSSHKEAGISIPAIERQMAGRYNPETAYANKLMGKELFNRITRLEQKGLIEKTAYLVSYRITESGLKQIVL